ncbi:hypothetical protein QMP26_32425 [Enterocloster clostridioformis]
MMTQKINTNALTLPLHGFDQQQVYDLQAGFKHLRRPRTRLQANASRTPIKPSNAPALNGCAIASSIQAIHHPTNCGTGRRRAAYFLRAKKSKREEGRSMNSSVRSPPH